MITDEITAKKLFRKFFNNRSTPLETGRVINLLQFEESKQWFSEVMDERMKQAGNSPDSRISIEDRFNGLVSRLNDFSGEMETRNK